jgi:hypothetical protein
MKNKIKLFDPTIVTIPIHPNLKNFEIKKIIDVVNKSL